MVGDILRSVTQSEAEAESIIAEAKEKAIQVKNEAKDEIKSKKTSEAVSFAEAADKRRAAVREEEERKDKEYKLKISEELEGLAAEALKDEEHIIAQLSKKVYAL